MGYHDSIEAKLACARLLHEEAEISRDILVDDLSGSVHRAYGLMPNMTWVIDRAGEWRTRRTGRAPRTWRHSWAGSWRHEISARRGRPP
jgi:hypothetical protein